MQGSDERKSPRPFLGVHFECCSVYQRIYRSRDSQEYRGRCPRCLRVVSIRVGEGGRDVRFFRAR